MTIHNLVSRMMSVLNNLDDDWLQCCLRQRGLCLSWRLGKIKMPEILDSFCFLSLKIGNENVKFKTYLSSHIAHQLRPLLLHKATNKLIILVSEQPNQSSSVYPVLLSLMGEDERNALLKKSRIKLVTET